MNKEEEYAEERRLVRNANRLGKWRKLLAGWVLGTRLDDDGPAAGMRDLQEARLLLRAEVTSLIGLLIDKGVFSRIEFATAMANECDLLNDDMAMQFPGFTATDNGLELKLPEAAETMKRLKFPA